MATNKTYLRTVGKLAFSVIIVIPAELAKEMKIKRGNTMKIKQSGTSIIMKKVNLR
jgi:antitoxin component of MazEF toxin-antitoxin module